MVTAYAVYSATSLRYTVIDIVIDSTYMIQDSSGSSSSSQCGELSDCQDMHVEYNPSSAMLYIMS